MHVQNRPLLGVEGTETATESAIPQGLHTALGQRLKGVANRVGIDLQGRGGCPPPSTAWAGSRTAQMWSTLRLSRVLRWDEHSFEYDTILPRSTAQLPYQLVGQPHVYSLFETMSPAEMQQRCAIKFPPWPITRVFGKR
jgi:hypothetical protein